MEALSALFWSVIGGFIVLAINKIYRAYKKKTMKDDLDSIEFEITHLEAMKKSSVEMNRSSFRGLFFMFFLIALANVVPSAFSFFGDATLNYIASILQFGLWFLVAAVAYKFWQRYDNLKNFKEACVRLEAKKEKLQSKLKNS